jgi:hypothetical protein
MAANAGMANADTISSYADPSIALDDYNPISIGGGLV